MTTDSREARAYSDGQLQDLVAASDTGARAPTNAIAAQTIVFVALAWSLFQLWIASPLPFITGLFIINDAEARAIHLAFAVFLGFLAFPALAKDIGPGQGVPVVSLILALLPTTLFVATMLTAEQPLSEVWRTLVVVVLAGVLIIAGALQTSRARIPLVDWLLAGVGAFCASYGFWFYDGLSARPGSPIPEDILISVTGLVILLEATRRALGPPLAIVALVFLTYIFFGDSNWLPDDIRYPGASLSRAMSHMWLGPEGVFGIAVGVSTRFVFLFVLFGALLERAGAGNYFIQVAFSLLGHLRGGPAKAAVVASGMTGLISGSSIANVVTTGTFTVPLMKRVGFSSEKAGAVEVASSVNGQIMPPVMGAAAFLMVEYVGIPYTDVIRHAFLPAVISYIALVYIVHLEALKSGMQGLPRPGEPLGMKWSLISFGITACSLLIIAGLLYYVFAAAALIDDHLWAFVGAVALFALQALCLRTIHAALPRERRRRFVSGGAIVLVNVLIGAFALFHGMELLKLIAGDALGWAVCAVLAGAVIALIYYASRFPELRKPEEGRGNGDIRLPEIGPTVKSGLHFLLPIVVLVWCLMVERLSPALSAFWATALMIAILLTQRPLFALFRGTGQGLAETVPAGFVDLFHGLVTGARNMIGIGIATATAGIVVGTVTLTGIGLVLAGFVETLSGGSIIIMLFLVAVLSLILGMGLPTTANYIVVSSLMAPVIVQVGAANGLLVPLIAVHLFVFYFGIMADVTPPVGLASFAAAAVSGGDPLKTGVTAFYYSLRTAALPFLFIFNTDLILVGVQTLPHIILVFSTATVAMLIFAAATQGYFMARSRIYESVALLLIAFTIFRPGAWMDQIFPPVTTAPGSEVLQVAEQTQPGGSIRLIMEGQDFDTLEMVRRTVLLPVGDGDTGEARLAASGLHLREEAGTYIVDLVAFFTPAHDLGIERDFAVLNVLVDNEVPPAELMWIPAFGLLLVIVVVQRRRARRQAADPALASASTSGG